MTDRSNNQQYSKSYSTNNPFRNIAVDSDLNLYRSFQAPQAKTSQNLVKTPSTGDSRNDRVPGSIKSGKDMNPHSVIPLTQKNRSPIDNYKYVMIY